MSTNKESELVTSPVFENEWMLRPCEMYHEEYSDCTSIKARFHQYFIFGETQDCSQWKRDYNNCVKWKEEKDVKAANELLESEMARRKARLAPHYANDIWERRTSPPEDWDKPLPEHILKNYENSYLALKAKELKDEHSSPNLYQERTLCVIM